MMSIDCIVNILLNSNRDRIERIRKWSDTVFYGMELPLLAGLVGTLVADRKITARDVVGAMPHDIAELPWEGCEQQLFESIIAALRERDHSDDDIRSIIETLGTHLSEAFEQAQETIDEPRPMFYVGPIAEA